MNDSAAADGTGRLERTIGQVLRWGTVASSVCLACGLLLVLAGYDDRLSHRLLEAGVLALMATPVGRVMVSVVEYIRDRDWLFAALTLIVLAALAGSVAVALFF
ncbi:MAG TPA: DUF1634 domain-containing protein [Vicinamibacterales bacterium]|nr:DUF1634 domain-containing protein [Vicinamibacterales bacterium]